MLLTLVIIMMIITLFLYYGCKQSILSPAIAFMAPFSFATLYLLINTSRWNVVLELDTLLVIVGGSLCFLLGNLFVSLVCGINKGNRKEYIEKTNYQNDNNINISKVILIIGLGVELFCLLY